MLRSSEPLASSVPAVRQTTTERGKRAQIELNVNVADKKAVNTSLLIVINHYVKLSNDENDLNKLKSAAESFTVPTCL